MDRQTPFFKPGGTLDPSAESYIVRRADEQLLAALLAREYVFLLDSRQKGKSSLIARAIVKLRDERIRPVKLDLQRIGANVTPEQWYAGLAFGIGQEMGLQAEMLQYWQSTQAIGPLARFVGALHEVVLARTTIPVVIFVDEIDFVRALDFPTDEFFGGIRECYNRRANDEAFRRLTFCLVGVATPGQLIRNPDVSPFNIGVRIDLTDFSLEETYHYAKSLNGNGRRGDMLVDRVHHWVGGHPYLTQLLCSRVAADAEISSPAALDALVREMLFSPEARQREPNLADVERRLLDPDVPGMTPEERRVQVLDLYGRMLKSSSVDATEQNPVVATLRLSGIGVEETGCLRVRNLVYRTVFDNAWRVHNLPEAEVRRQDAATRRATLRTAAVAGVVILAVTATAVGMFKISKERENALVTLQLRTNDLNRVSTDRQRALTALGLRNDDLKRASTEKQAALNTLGERNQELTRLSTERQRALNALRLRTEEVKRVSAERGRSLQSLGQRTEELQRRNYLGLMASIRLAIQEGRWTMASELIDQAKNSPLRGWEWGYVAKLISGYTAENQLLPMRNEFEQDPDGSLSVTTRDAIYKVTPSGLKLRRKLTGRILLPLGRKGNLRFGVDPVTFECVLRDAASDQIVMVTDAEVHSFDPVTQTMIVLANSTFEKRSFDGKVLEVMGPRDYLARAILSNGDQISLHRDGLLIRTDSNRKKVVESRVLPPPRTGSQSISLSKDEKLFMHFDDGSPRLLQVRSASDLSIVATLDAPPTLGGVAAFSSDNRSILVATGGLIVRYDVKSGKSLQFYCGHKSMVQRMAFLPDGHHFASLDRSGVLHVWQTEPPPAVETLGAPSEPLWDVWRCNDPRFLVCATATHSVESRDLQTGKIARFEKPVGASGAPWTTIVSGNKVFAGNGSGRVDRLSLDGLKPEKSVQVFDGPITGIFKLMGGKRLLVETDPVDMHIAVKYSIVDPKSLSVMHELRPGWPAGGVNYGRVWHVASDGPLFGLFANSRWTTARENGGTGLIHLFSADSGKILRRMKFKSQITAAAIIPDGSKVIVSFYTGLENPGSRIEVFETKTGKQVGTLQVPKSNVVMQFDIVGDLLSCFLADGNIGTWHLSKGPECKVISPGQSVGSFDVSPDQSRILTCLTDGSVMIWDTMTGEDLLTLHPESYGGDKVSSIKTATVAIFSQDGTKIFTYCPDGVLRAFDSLPWKDQPKAARK